MLPERRITADSAQIPSAIVPNSVAQSASAPLDATHWGLLNEGLLNQEGGMNIDGGAMRVRWQCDGMVARLPKIQVGGDHYA